jgi:hypothetical protein
MVWFRYDAIVGGGYVATGEDVGGGEGGGCLHAVEEEDVIERGDEDYAGGVG